MLDWLKEKKKMGPDIKVVMNLKTSLPMILPINDWGIETTHEDQVPQCSNCYKIGHFASRCGAPSRKSNLEHILCLQMKDGARH